MVVRDVFCIPAPPGAPGAGYNARLEIESLKTSLILFNLIQCSSRKGTTGRLVSTVVSNKNTTAALDFYEGETSTLVPLSYTHLICVCPIYLMWDGDTHVPAKITYRCGNIIKMCSDRTKLCGPFDFRRHFDNIHAV